MSIEKKPSLNLRKVAPEGPSQIKIEPSNKINQHQTDNNRHQQSQMSLSSNTRKHKLPEIILKYIMDQAKKNEEEEQANKKNKSKAAKTAEMFTLRQKPQTSKCEICDIDVIDKEKISMSACPHKYCASCLHQYIIYKISSFQSVECPCEGCNLKLDETSKLYSELPLLVREKYKKYKQYAETIKNPDLKICPNEKCEGFLQTAHSNDPLILVIANPQCNVCKKIYCSICMFAEHEGECDPFQLSFFQDTLHYRQCSKCKNVIQKTQGCNHMTCRCGYQFCYICGGRWYSSHVCNNPNQEPIYNEQQCGCCCTLPCCPCCYACCNQLQINCDICCENTCDALGVFYECQCCECCECCDCQCDCTNSTCCVVILKILYLLFWLIILLPVVLFQIVLNITLRVLVGIMIGLFAFPCLIQESNIEIEYYHIVGGILLLPITLIFFMYLGWKQTFDDDGIQQIKQIICLPCEMMDSFCTD